MANDKKTLDLIKEVNRQKTEIAKIEKPNWKTNCSFSYTEGNMNAAVSIHVESSLKNLISIAAFLQDKEKSYGEAAKVLDINNPPDFTWNGFTVKDWISDLKMRIDKLQIGIKKKKLELFESRLNAIISPELKAQLELEAIEKELY